MEKHGAEFSEDEKQRNTFHCEILLEYKPDLVNNAGIPCINSAFNYPEIKA